MGMLGRMGLDWGKRDPKGNDWRLDKQDKKEKRDSLTKRILGIGDVIRDAEHSSSGRVEYEAAISQLDSIISEAETEPPLDDVAGNARHWKEVYQAKHSQRYH